MTDVEAHADIVEAPGMQQIQQRFRRRKLVGNVLDQQLHAQRFGESVQVFEGAHCRIQFVLVRLFVAHSDMLHQKLKWRQLGYLDGALDFIRGRYTLKFLNRRNVDVRRAAASPIFVGMHGRVHRVERYSGAAKPVGDLPDVLPVSVVEVPACGEDLDGFRPAGDHLVEQARMQPFPSRVDQSRHGAAH
jgi:hypothetical protein